MGGMSASDQSYTASLEASRAAVAAAEARAEETRLDMQRGATQEAIDAAERERNARRLMAAQLAHFAGGSIDPFSGSPVAIQERTAGEINRESRLAGIGFADRRSTLSRQALGEIASGKGKSASIIGSAITNRQISRSNMLKQGASLISNVRDFSETIRGA
jgi:hypothetical protein